MPSGFWPADAIPGRINGRTVYPDVMVQLDSALNRPCLEDHVLGAPDEEGDQQVEHFKEESSQNRTGSGN